MWPLLLGAAAALLFIPGCTSRGNGPEPQTPKKPEAKDPPLPRDFRPDDRAQWVYLNLKLNGIADRELDQGCPNLDLAKGFYQGQRRAALTFGRNDGRLSSCEIYEYLFNRWDKYPQLTETMTGTPIPWSLNDGDPITESDANLRFVSSRVVAGVGTYLKEKGFHPHSPGFDERLALYLLALLGKLPHQLSYEGLAVLGPVFFSKEKYQTIQENLAKEFTRLGIKELWEGMEDKGGLLPFGLTTERHSALTAVRTGNAGRMERVKLLYGMFREAGLDPYFTLIHPRSLPGDPMIAMGNTPNFYLMAVGLDIGGQNKIYDPTHLLEPGSSPPQHPLTLRQFFACDLSNGGNLMQIHDQAIEYYDRALDLDEQNSIIWGNRANRWINLGENKLALSDAQVAYRLDPDSPGPMELFAMALVLNGKAREGLELANEALKKYPQYYWGYYARALAHTVLGQPELGKKDLITFIRLAPDAVQSIFNDLVVKLTVQYEQSPEENRHQFEDETGDFHPPTTIAFLNLATFYWEAGHKDRARMIVSEYFQTLQQRRNHLKSQGKDFSPAVQGIIQDQIFRPLGEIGQDSEVLEQWEALGDFFRDKNQALGGQEMSGSYPVEFPPNHKAHWLYLNLKQKGVKDSDMDQGCPHWDYSDPTIPKVKVSGAQDKKISSCEVFETTLDHYEQFPRLAQILTAGPIPWALDDGNPLTEKDQAVRDLIQQHFLKKIYELLKKQPYAPGTPAYQERLALALMAAVHLPPNWYRYERVVKESPHLLDKEGHLKALQGLEAEFQRLGMVEIWQHLRKVGGIIPVYTTEQERSALQAFQDARGKCTENSKTLFALYRMAGFKPKFVFVKPRLAADPALQEQAEIHPEVDHVAVGVEIGGKFLIYDPTLFKPKAPFPYGVPLSLRLYLAMDFTNRGIKGNSPERILEFFNQAYELEVFTPYVFIGRSKAWAQMQELDRALVEAKRAEKLAPHDASVLLTMAGIYLSAQSFSKALDYADKAVEFFPKYSMGYFTRGSIKRGLKREEEARADFIIALKLDSELASQLMPYLLPHWARIYPELNLPPTLAEELGDIKSIQFLAQWDVARMLSAAGYADKAQGMITSSLQKLVQRREALLKEKKDFSPAVKERLWTFFKEFEEDPTLTPLFQKLGFMAKSKSISQLKVKP